MAKKTVAVATVKKHSIQVVDGMEVVFPQSGAVETVDYVAEIAKKCDGCYNRNFNILSFVTKGKMFVTYATTQVVDSLEAAGMKQSDELYVPFSNWSYPKNESQVWDEICARGKKLSE